MVQFPFRTNLSFGEYSGHPITIPRSFVDYCALEEEIGSIRSGTMEFPDGTVVPAKIHKGTAGYGQYYQIRALRSSQWASSMSNRDRAVQVSVSKVARELRTRLKAR